MRASPYSLSNYFSKWSHFYLLTLTMYEHGTERYHLKKKKREKTKNLCLFVSWKMGSSCLVLSFFHVFIESFSFMNHLFVPFTGIYIWGKQLVSILMQFRCSKSKGNPKKKLMKLKAFWFIAVSFPRIPRQNVKEIGGFSRAQSFGLYASEPRNERQGTWI